MEGLRTIEDREDYKKYWCPDHLHILELALFTSTKTERVVSSDRKVHMFRSLVHTWYWRVYKSSNKQTQRSGTAAAVELVKKLAIKHYGDSHEHKRA